MEHSTVKI